MLEDPKAIIAERGDAAKELSDDDLFGALPLKRSWLNDIVDVLLRRPDGIAPVQAIAIEIMKSGRDVGATPEETITRTINNYCGNANDTNCVVKHDLFERTGPAAYRLRSYPSKPDLIEIEAIRFADRAHASAWKDFCARAVKSPRWRTLSKRQRLILYARAIRPEGPFRSVLDYWSGVLERASLDDLI